MFLVTGKAEQMPSVMHEFVHVPAMNKRGSSLLSADEIDRQQHQQSAEHSPGQKLTDRDNRKRNGLRNRSGGRGGHLETSWDRASRVERIGDEGRTGSRPYFGRLQWRDRSGIPPASSFHLLVQVERSCLRCYCQGVHWLPRGSLTKLKPE
jgi:hypothetical protein